MVGAYSEYMLRCFLASPSSVSLTPMIPSEYTRIPFFPERFTWYTAQSALDISSFMDAAAYGAAQIPQLTVSGFKYVSVQSRFMF